MPTRSLPAPLAEEEPEAPESTQEEAPEPAPRPKGRPKSKPAPRPAAVTEAAHPKGPPAPKLAAVGTILACPECSNELFAALRPPGSGRVDLRCNKCHRVYPTGA